MFPEGTKIISMDFSSKRDYTAEVRLKCKSKEDFKIWLAEFQNMTNNAYRVLTTSPKTGQKVLYKATYRCHRNTYPSSHKIKKPSQKHTGCPAKLNVTIKAIVERPRNRSKDTLAAEYPTIVKIQSNHNHNANVAELDSTWYTPLVLGKESKEHGTDVHESVPVGSELEENDGEDPAWEATEIEINKIAEIIRVRSKDTLVTEYPTIVKIQNNSSHNVNVAELDPTWYATLYIGKESKELATDVHQYVAIESELQENVANEFVTCSSVINDDEDPAWEASEIKIKEIVEIIRDKFKRNPKAVANAVHAMHKSVRNMKTDSAVLSAMYNFGKVSTACKKSTTVSVQPIAIARQKSAIGTRR